MKIIWLKNPLESRIEIEGDLERDLFRLRIENDAYKWGVMGARFHLDGKSVAVDIERALKELWVADRRSLKEEVDRDLEMHISELSGCHCGDCTCVPCSCAKCQAEELLGVNTIDGLGKHSAYKIDSVIRSDPQAPIDAILNRLANPDYSKPNEHYAGKEDLWFSCVPRWTQESHRAHEWLKKYYEDHPEAANVHGQCESEETK